MLLVISVLIISTTYSLSKLSLKEGITLEPTPQEIDLLKENVDLVEELVKNSFSLETYYTYVNSDEETIDYISKLYTLDKFKIKDLSEKNKNALLFKSLPIKVAEEENKQLIELECYSYFTVEDYKNMYKKVFGENIADLPETITPVGEINYILKEEEQLYCRSGVGSSIFSPIKYGKVISAKQNGNSITIVEQIYFQNVEFIDVNPENFSSPIPKYSLCSDYNCETILFGPVDAIGEIEEIKESGIFINYQDKLEKYEHTYTKNEEGNYIYRSIKKIK